MGPETQSSNDGGSFLGNSISYRLETSSTCRKLSVVGSGVGMGLVPDGTNGPNGLGPMVTSRTCNIIYGFQRQMKIQGALFKIY